MVRSSMPAVEPSSSRSPPARAARRSGSGPRGGGRRRRARRCGPGRRCRRGRARRRTTGSRCPTGSATGSPAPGPRHACGAARPTPGPAPWRPARCARSTRRPAAPAPRAARSGTPRGRGRRRGRGSGRRSCGPWVRRATRAYRASPTSGSRPCRSSARSSLRRDMVRDQPSCAEHLVAGELVARPQPLGATVLRAPQVMHALEQLGGRPVLQPPPAPDVRGQILARQRGRRQASRAAASSASGARASSSATRPTRTSWSMLTARTLAPTPDNDGRSTPSDRARKITAR